MSNLPRRTSRSALAALALAVLLSASATQAVEAGETAPSFQLPGLTGGTVSLEEHRGKVVYLDFWASWCGPCAQALPALDALRQEFPEEDFQVVAINVDGKSAAAKKFLKRRPVGYPSGLDPKGETPAQFGVETMPTSFLIDRNGTVHHVHKGFRKQDVESLRKRIQALVAAGR